MAKHDESVYLAMLLEPIKICEHYRPALGTSEKDGVSLKEFQALFARDPLYSWLGLSSPELYAAHKAAGGITSFYRQLGIGCERLVRRILMDAFGITESQAKWSYTYQNSSGESAVLSLDGRIDAEMIKPADRQRVLKWVEVVAAKAGIESKIRSSLKGIVLEVRQGYKSADSKRQNADLRNAVRAYNAGYVPAMMIMSNQINTAVRARYESANITMLSGLLNKDCFSCTYAFMEDVVGYSLSSFFEANTDEIRLTVRRVVSGLLRP